MASRSLCRAHCLRSSLAAPQPTRRLGLHACQTRTFVSSSFLLQTPSAIHQTVMSTMPDSRRYKRARYTHRPTKATASFSTTAPSEMAAQQKSMDEEEVVDMNSSQDEEATSTIAPTGMPYSAMKGRLHPALLEALEDMKYTHMSPVQEKVLDGKLLQNLSDDAIVQAKTGTGKTTAFLLPTLQTLLESRKSLPKGQVGVLILSPTRDLAIQIGKECDQLTAKTSPRVECHLAYGGSNKDANLRRFMSGNPSILVATPGRLGDYLSSESVQAKFKHMRALVLDEADTMLDSGFLMDLLKILKVLPSKQSAGWQGLLYSATMPPKMREVTHHVVPPNCVTISTISADDTPTVDSIPQSLYVVDSVRDVFPALQALLRTEYETDQDRFKVVVFTHTARNAGLLHAIFSDPATLPEGLSVYQMQSRMSQSARDRTVREFKAAKAGVLFASDVVGRGMDFPDVSLVVQVGLPQTSDQYVHRVGRTGRAGKSGRAVMILMPEEQQWAANHPQYPMQRQNVSDLDVDIEDCRASIDEALSKVPDQLKTQAYVAILGYLKSNGKYILKQPVDMIELANEFSRVIGFEEPPELEAKTVGKMGFRGMPGLRVVGRGSRPSPAMSGRGGYGGQGGGRQDRPCQEETVGSRRVRGAAKRGLAY